ncbi:MAG TPA: hypothetical protein VKT73_10780 [Xanthobacteraceae bacterium]|nr:hypothetical protein [Xanthobacteraceae bacterium]
MLKKLMPAGAMALVLALAHSSSPQPAAAVPVQPGAAKRGAEAATIFVRRWIVSRYDPQPSGVPVFIIPGLYWGPAWWDPNYSKLCWRKVRACKECAEKWIFVC